MSGAAEGDTFRQPRARTRVTDPPDEVKGSEVEDTETPPGPLRILQKADLALDYCTVTSEEASAIVLPVMTKLIHSQVCETGYIEVRVKGALLADTRITASVILGDSPSDGTVLEARAKVTEEILQMVLTRLKKIT